jgi:hypothetical protein
LAWAHLSELFLIENMPKDVQQSDNKTEPEQPFNSRNLGDDVSIDVSKKSWSTLLKIRIIENNLGFQYMFFLCEHAYFCAVRGIKITMSVVKGNFVNTSSDFCKNFTLRKS